MPSGRPWSNVRQPKFDLLHEVPFGRATCRLMRRNGTGDFLSCITDGSLEKRRHGAECLSIYPGG